MKCNTWVKRELLGPKNDKELVVTKRIPDYYVAHGLRKVGKDMELCEGKIKAYVESQGEHDLYIRIYCDKCDNTFFPGTELNICEEQELSDLLSELTATLKG